MVNETSCPRAGITASRTENPRRRRFVSVVCFLILLSLLALGAWQGPLVYLISTIADETYPTTAAAAAADIPQVAMAKEDGSVGPRVLQIGSLNELNRYSIPQLGWYLTAPSPRWRAVVCQALALRDSPGETSDWRGAALRLARMAASDVDRQLQRLALEALRRPTKLPDADGIAMAAIAAKAQVEVQRLELFELLAVQSEPIRARLCEVVRELAQSPVAANRRTAFQILARHYPDHAATSLTLLKQFAGERTVEFSPTDEWGVRQLAVVQPGLFEELLGSAPPAQSLALRAISRRLGQTTMPDNAAGLKKALIENELAAANDWRGNEKLFDRADAVCEAVLNAPPAEHAVPELSVAVNYIRGAARPSARRLLLDALFKRSDSAGQVAILQTVTQMLQGDGAVRQMFVLRKDETDQLINLLNASEGGVARGAGRLVLVGSRAPSIFAAGEGPLDPGRADVFRKHLQSRDPTLEQLAITYFCNVGAPTDPDLQALDKYVRAAVRHLASSESVLRTLKSRFPRHPTTVALMRDWPEIEVDAKRPRLQAGAASGS